MMQKTFIFSFLLFLFSIGIVSAISITDNNPTNIVTPNSTYNLNFSFTTDYLNNLTYSFNGTNYLIYDPSLVLFYNFDNRSALGENDTLVKDLSIYGNNASVIGGSLNISNTPNGFYGNAYKLSGNTSYINVTSLNLQFVSNSSLTISAWIKMTGAGPNTASSQPVVTTKYVYMQVRGSNLVARSGNATASFISTSSAPIPDITSWHFVTIQFSSNGTNTNVSTFIDGIYSSSTLADSLSTAAQTTGGELLEIGRVSTGYFNGTIDDVKIWNRTLSNQEIYVNYKLSITKHDIQNWSLSVNQTSINSNTKNFYSCITNITAEICSVTNNIRSLNTVTSNFGTSVGIVRSDFYGVNTHGSYLTLPGTGVNDTYNQLLFKNSKMKIIRIDAHLDGTTGSSAVNTFDTTRMLRYTNLVNLAKANGYKIYVSMNYMPSWLANTTIPDASCSANNLTCPPYNYTIWGQVNVNFLNNISCDASTCSVEVWNEPYLSTYLLGGAGNDATNASIRAKYYNLIYNASYLAIKQAFPTMQVGGFVGGSDDIRGTAQMQGFLSNFSTKFDFIAYHRYLENGDNNATYSTLLSSRLGNIYSNCTSYGAVNCSNLYYSEYGILNVNTLADSTLLNQNIMQLTSFDNYLLNNLPANISTMYFEWEGTGYQMQNETIPAIYLAYSVMSNQTRYAPASSTVYSSSNDADNGCIQQVSTMIGSTRNLIITNTCSDPKNVSLSSTGSGTGIRVNDGQLITIQSGIPTNLGVMQGYDVWYYTTPYYFPSADGTTEIRNYLGEGLGSIPTPSSLQGTASCVSMLDQLAQYPVLIGLIGAVFFVGLIILILTGFVALRSGFGLDKVVGGFLAIVGIGALLIIGIFIIDNLCTVGIIVP